MVFTMSTEEQEVAEQVERLMEGHSALTYQIGDSEIAGIFKILRMARVRHYLSLRGIAVVISSKEGNIEEIRLIRFRRVK